jgi:hypothetical protein
MLCRWCIGVLMRCVHARTVASAHRGSETYRVSVQCACVTSLVAFFAFAHAAAEHAEILN